MNTLYDVESNLIALLLSIGDQRLVRRIADQMQPDDFANNNYCEVMGAVKRLIAANRSVDMVSVWKELKEDTQQVVLIATETHLWHAENAEEYVCAVKNQSRTRKLLRGINEVAGRLGREQCDAAEAMAMLAQLQANLSIGSGKALKTLPEIVLDEYSAMSRRTSGEDVPVQMGIEAVDQITGGMAQGELWILAARPSVGKSALAMQIALSVAKAKKTALFCSLEMSEAMIAQRFFASQGVESHKIRNGTLTAEDWELAGEAVAAAAEYAGMHTDERSRKVAEMRTNARTLQAERGLDLIAVDYLQIARPDGTQRRNGTRNEEVSGISADLKAMAKELGVPVLALSQLSRKRDNTAPDLSDLRDSGAIEQDADGVIMLQRLEEAPEDDTEGLYDTAQANGWQYIRAYVRKNRMGAVGYVDLWYVPPMCRFMQASIERIHDPEQIRLKENEQ